MAQTKINDSQAVKKCGKLWAALYKDCVLSTGHKIIGATAKSF